MKMATARVVKEGNMIPLRSSPADLPQTTRDGCDTWYPAAARAAMMAGFHRPPLFQARPPGGWHVQLGRDILAVIKGPVELRRLHRSLPPHPVP
jgi:hypothetical protein